MMDDEVIREVRAAREAFAAAHGNDIQAMVAALQALDASDGREVVRFAPRPPQVIPTFPPRVPTLVEAPAPTTPASA